MTDFHSSPTAWAWHGQVLGTVRQLPSANVSFQPGKNSAARWLFT